METAYNEMVIKPTSLLQWLSYLATLNIKRILPNKVTFNYIWHANKLTSQEESEKKEML